MLLHNIKYYYILLYTTIYYYILLYVTLYTINVFDKTNLKVEQTSGSFLN